VAIWGPTGLGLVYGHDQLESGFNRALWSAPPRSATLDDLVQAGYMELYLEAGCCQETLRTYALLGDPLTKVQAFAAHPVYLPILQR
jgi:hypothetical protein